jgi:hypothetical protein
MQKHKVTRGTKFHFQKQNSVVHEVTFEKHKVVLCMKLYLKNKVVPCMKLYLKNIKSFYAWSYIWKTSLLCIKLNLQQLKVLLCIMLCLPKHTFLLRGMHKVVFPKTWSSSKQCKNIKSLEARSSTCKNKILLCMKLNLKNIKSFYAWNYFWKT